MEIEIPTEQLHNSQAEASKLLELPMFDNNESEAKRHRTKEVTERNQLPIPNTSETILRYGLSETQTAAVASAYLMDLIQAGHLPASDVKLTVDSSKVKRGRDKVMAAARERGNKESLEDNIKAIFFDGQKDKTKVKIYKEETGKHHPRLVKENHVTMVSEPDGKYRHHFTPEEPNGSNKPAKEEAKKIYEWLKENKVEESIKLVGGDSTNSNTGWAGGAIAWLEKLLGKKLFWAICMLHTNELPLRQG